MKIPASFSKAIAQAFYDKEITVHHREVVVDELGQEVITVGNIALTLKGSVKFNELGLVQEEYGLDKAVDISISLPPKTNVPLGSFVKYDSVVYEVKGAVPFDTALMVLGSLWP